MNDESGHIEIAHRSAGTTTATKPRKALPPSGASSRPGIWFDVEPFRAIMRELPPLFYEHWQEIALDKDVIALDPDFDRYVAMDLAGILLTHTVRVDGILVGYFISLVLPALHYRRSLQAFTDIYYLAKAARRGHLAQRFFQYVAADLKRRGVQKQSIMRKLHTDPRIGLLWERLGYRPIEVHYSKLL